MKSRPARHHSVPTVAHRVINKLSTVIGNCDLLIEKTEHSSELAQRLVAIREAAQHAVEELTIEEEAKAQRTKRKKAS